MRLLLGLGCAFVVAGALVRSLLVGAGVVCIVRVWLLAMGGRFLVLASSMGFLLLALGVGLLLRGLNGGSLLLVLGVGFRFGCGFSIATLGDFYHCPWAWASTVETRVPWAPWAH